MKYRFTSIHGTFSASAEWIHEHEQEFPEGFRARLAGEFNSEVAFSVPPAWGATSWRKKWSDLTNVARLEGAAKLKQHILAQEVDEHEKHFLLAHSHGGNVALYALQDEQLRQRIDGVICMATPFLYPRLRPLRISTLILSLLIMLAGFYEFLSKITVTQTAWIEWASAALLFIIAIIVPAFLTWIVISQRYKRKFVKDKVFERHIDMLSYQDPGKPILLIRASGDEASGLLRSMQFLNWGAGKAMRLGAGQLYAIALTALLLLLGSEYFQIISLPDTLLSVMGFGLLLIAIVIVLMLIVLSVSRIGVGLDAWRWVGEIETMVEDGPPGMKSELVVIKPRPSTKGLSHTAVYSEPETTHAIAQWCRSH